MLLYDCYLMLFKSHKISIWCSFCMQIPVQAQGANKAYSSGFNSGQQAASFLDHVQLSTALMLLCLLRNIKLSGYPLQSAPGLPAVAWQHTASGPELFAFSTSECQHVPPLRFFPANRWHGSRRLIMVSHVKQPKPLENAHIGRWEIYVEHCGKRGDFAFMH